MPLHSNETIVTLETVHFFVSVQTYQFSREPTNYFPFCIDTYFQLLPYSQRAITAGSFQFAFLIFIPFFDTTQSQSNNLKLQPLSQLHNFAGQTQTFYEIYGMWYLIPKAALPLSLPLFPSLIKRLDKRVVVGGRWSRGSLW